MNSTKLNRYFRDFDKLGLYVCYYDYDEDHAKYRIGYIPKSLLNDPNPVETKRYTFKEFYDEFWSKGFKHEVLNDAASHSKKIYGFYKLIGLTM